MLKYDYHSSQSETEGKRQRGIERKEETEGRDIRETKRKSQRGTDRGERQGKR
jgi:hypothetical protein